MVEIGYKLNTEEHNAPTLVKNARLAEDAGFDFVSLTDHYHPRNRIEGQSPSPGPRSARSWRPRTG